MWIIPLGWLISCDNYHCIPSIYCNGQVKTIICHFLMQHGEEYLQQYYQYSHWHLA